MFNKKPLTDEQMDKIREIFAQHDESKFMDKFFADIDLMCKVSQFLQTVDIQLTIGFPFEGEGTMETFRIGSVADGGEKTYEDIETIIGQLLLLKISPIVKKRGGFEVFPDFSSLVGFKQDCLTYEIMYFRNEEENKQFIKIMEKIEMERMKEMEKKYGKRN